MTNPDQVRIAYFSMEIAANSAFPTYAGGLGILAGDTLRRRPIWAYPSLYGGDPMYRLCQEAVLGIAGFRLLRVLGYRKIERFHMNEGQSALLAVALLQERLG
jgi:glucan phosphorylase